MKRWILSPTNIYEEATKRYEELCKVKYLIEKKMNRYPEGKIHIIKKNTRVQYYIRRSAADKSGEYLSKHQTDTIKLFLQKKYEEEVVKLINLEKNNLEKFLKNFQNLNIKIQQQFSDYPQEVKDYIEPYDMADEDYISRWLAKPYQKKESPPTVPIFVTNNGEHVRSKSEWMIANYLLEHNIPYKYECPLCLDGGRIIHPDFTILDVCRRKEVYWEHRGMMDKQEYANHSVQRLKEYKYNGITLGDRLIITEETQLSPLDTKEIETVIMQHFLVKE